jgi:hypothetical protein
LLGRLIVLLALVGGLLWLLHWFRSTPPHQVAKALRKAMLWGGIGLVVLLVATGRLNPVFAALAAAVPVILRLVNLLQVLPVIRQLLRSLGISVPGAGSSTTSAAPGGASSIRTRFLEMTLDHASGHMDGRVLEGPDAGRLLSELELGRLLDLLARCRVQDAQSAALLEAYLDRTQGEDWRASSSSRGRNDGAVAADAPLNREEAMAILGLGPGATDEDVREAHRRLIQKLHPDRGGSDYLAAKINAAKDLLLGE